MGDNTRDAPGLTGIFLAWRRRRRPSSVADLLVKQRPNDAAPVVFGDLLFDQAGGGPSPITGTLAATETGSDSAALAGKVGVSGALAGTESGADTSALSGAVHVAGSLAASEAGADALAVAGKVLVSGALAVSESGVDAFAASGAVRVSGALAVAESGADAFSVSGAAQVSGALAVSEAGSDALSASGAVPITGMLAASESGTDTLAASGTLTSAPSGVTGLLAALEAGADLAAILGKVIRGALNAATLAAITTAVWAHPQGQAYLAKIDQIEALSIACGNPCCANGMVGTGWPQSFQEAWLQAHRKAQEEAARLAALQPMPEAEEFVVGPQEPIYTPPELYIPTPAEIEAMFRRNLEAMRAAAPKLAEQIEAEATAEEEAVIHLMNWMME